MIPRFNRLSFVKYCLAFIVVLFAATFYPTSTTQAQTSKPFIFPIAGPPGPNNWLFGQPYGNSTGAFNFGTAWYSAGQGLHFGIDISTPCGTPLVAIGDGTVMFADNLAFGSGPHNLLIRHDAAGYVSLYGHLLERPTLSPGQTVRQGEVVGKTGDPDSTCISRPHFHLEIRSLDYGTTYNPIDTINVNWHSLAIVGSFQSTLFQGDMDNSRRWMSLDDQPTVQFGGRILNGYFAPFPPANDLRPPSNALLPRTLSPLPENITWTSRTVGEVNCCWQRWWHPTDANRLYMIDGVEGVRASVHEVAADSGELTGVTSETPPPYTSPDGSYEIFNNAGQTALRRVADNFVYAVFTGGQTPSISPDNSRMMWVTTAGASVPGQGRLPSTVWMADINGNNGRMVVSGAGLSARWLDGSRLLVSVPEDERVTRLKVYDTANPESEQHNYEVGAWTWMRGLSVAPGGGRLLFYRTHLSNPDETGLYTVDVHPGATARRLNWFGGWQWRDNDSVYYIPLNADATFHTLRYYNLATDEDRLLADTGTMPFIVMNGDWSVSADGRRIAFTNGIDRRFTILEYTE